MSLLCQIKTSKTHGLKQAVKNNMNKGVFRSGEHEYLDYYSLMLMD